MINSEREEGTNQTQPLLYGRTWLLLECSGAHWWILSRGRPDLTFHETAAASALILKEGQVGQGDWPRVHCSEAGERSGGTGQGVTSGEAEKLVYSR